MKNVREVRAVPSPKSSRMDWNPERARIEAEARRTEHWTHWGPFLSERQWGTVREDYSATGEAWGYFPFEHGRLRAYRWGEDGIFGISDHEARLCLAPAFWNGNDPIIKERLFGLSGPQGNHGEDVKECYYYIDNVPSHSYMKALYKYPQRAFPYADLVATNARRTRLDPEYELIDTGIFDDDAYFDIEVEYAKHAPSDILMRITATNRGNAPAPLHVIPQLWFRNEWSWTPNGPRGRIVGTDTPHAYDTTHPLMSDYRLACDGTPDEFFVENETNFEVLYGVPNAQPYVKDGVCRAVRGENGTTNPVRMGSKLGLRYEFTLAPAESRTIRLRLTKQTLLDDVIPAMFDATFKERLWEADRFYAALNPYPASAEDHRVQRAAFAGMLWSKQFYYYVVRDWLRGDPAQPPPPPEEPFDEARLSELAGASYDRSFYPQGSLRQWSAVMTSPPRTERLKKLHIPTLVLHGTADTLIPCAAGRHTAQCIPGAEYHEIEGWGHDLPLGVLPELFGFILPFVAQVEEMREDGFATPVASGCCGVAAG